MTKRRGHNEGAIYQRKSDGRWVATLTLGYDGDRRRRRTFYGRSRPDVVSQLKAAQRQRDDGTLPAKAERLTVAAYLQRWLQSAKRSLRPNTWRRYEQYVRLHATPALGRVALTKLEAAHLDELYTKRIDAGLSPTTVRHLHAMLHNALRQAVRQGILSRNVADLVDVPKMRPRMMTTLSSDEVRALIDASASERLGAGVVLAVTTGLRRGELLALRWRDVDVERGQLQVRASLQWTKDGATFSEPKTAQSRRHVTLSRTAIYALRIHRLAQREEQRRRARVWQDQDLVFANEVGGPIEPHNFVRRTFARALKSAGVPTVRFHDLRHTAATLLLEQGVHPKIVSEMLGHSTIAMTLDLYSHVTPTMQRQAADAMDTAVGAPARAETVVQ